MKNSILLSALLFLPFSILEVKSQDLLELSPTIVVATKTPKDILDVMPSTAYISNAELNSRQFNELENALQYLSLIHI